MIIQTIMRTNLRKRLSYFFAPIALVLATVSVASGQETAYNASFAKAKEPIAVNVLVGQSRLISFDRPMERFSVSIQEFAEAVLVSGSQGVVNGRALGGFKL